MDRPPVPEPLKRQLRQEGAFGCCFCGHPFIEFHHIEPYAATLSHQAADMMVVCPCCHHQCTVGARSREAQRQAKESPYNKIKGYVDGQLVTDCKVIAVRAGSNVFVGAGFKFVVDDEQLLELRRDSAGRLLLTVLLRDAEDRVLMSMLDNEWVTGDPLPWDFEYGYNVVKLRSAARRVALEIDARATPVEITGELWRKGQQFIVSGHYLGFNGVVRKLAITGIGFVGSGLAADTRAGTFGIKPYGGVQGCIIGLTFKPENDLQLVTEAFEKQCREARVDGDAPCPCGSERKFKECHRPAPSLPRLDP